jgi:hypothetical protein
MYVAIHHTITDPKKWDEATKKLEPVIEGGKFPRGVKPLFYLPSTDGRRADCVWETDSMDTLKQFLNPYVAGASKDEYFQVNTELAMGIPAHAPERLAVHH